MLLKVTSDPLFFQKSLLKAKTPSFDGRVNIWEHCEVICIKSDEKTGSQFGNTTSHEKGKSRAHTHL